MNNKEYLEQISAQTRPVKTGKGPFGLEFNAKTIKILIGVAVAALLIIIIGAISGSGGDKNSERDYVDQIYLRSNNLMSAISNYNKRVKSSELRSMGNSLNAVLAELNFNITTILKEDFAAKSVGKPDKDKTQTTEDAIAEELNETLENARLNGVLDRTYAREFAYQIGLLESLESETVAKKEKETLINMLTASEENLEQLYDQFNNFAAN